MPPKSEASITQSIIRYCRGREWWHYKVWGSAFARAGVPDLIVCVRGAFVALEVKREGGHPSKLQLFEIKNIRDSGGVAEVVYSLEKAKEILDGVDSERIRSQYDPSESGDTADPPAGDSGESGEDRAGSEGTTGR